ncbi:hypothetical protein BT69DRAFT_146168 [Atractiella rhizophila]|nr:hypothetical protein BT69DRAFT_146168 [Atractiella rhizophila]
MFQNSIESFDLPPWISAEVPAQITLRAIPEVERAVHRIVNRFNNLHNHLQLFDDPLYADVAFSFAGAHGKTMKIYTASKLLCTASEYFNDMFAFGGFGSGSGSIRDDDSDKELDKAIFDQTLEPRDNPHSVTVVGIKHSCYSTYRAFLYYLLSGEISFAPLGSAKLQNEVCFEVEREAATNQKVYYKHSSTLHHGLLCHSQFHPSLCTDSQMSTESYHCDSWLWKALSRA